MSETPTKGDMPLSTDAPTQPTTVGTPKMDKLLGIQSGGSSCYISYFGLMDFLDDQLSFTSVFGRKPLHGFYPARVEQDSTRDTLRNYSDKCIFDVFLHLCWEKYVDTDDDTLISKMVHEICKRLAKLCMKYRPKTGNRLVTDTPDELYMQSLLVW